METYCPSIGEKFAPNYLCTQHCQAASIPWKKIPSESNYSHKSSSKLKILLNIALFLLAAVTAFFLAMKLNQSMDTRGKINVKDLKNVLSLLAKSGYTGDSQSEGKIQTNTQPNSHTKTTISCCQTIQISSSGPVLALYPSLLGTYQNINPPPEPPVYKLTGWNRFLSRPKGLTESGAHTYTWGVNSKLTATWGWIKGMEDKPCPHLISQWGVFKGGRKRWVQDQTLEIKCSV